MSVPIKSVNNIKIGVNPNFDSKFWSALAAYEGLTRVFEPIKSLNVRNPGRCNKTENKIKTIDYDLNILRLHHNNEQFSFKRVHLHSHRVVCNAGYTSTSSWRKATMDWEAHEIASISELSLVHSMHLALR